MAPNFYARVTMDNTDLPEPPTSPTHQAIMSMVDNYTHFETTYRQHPQAAVPVLEQVSLLRAALEVFRIAAEEKKEGEASAPDAAEQPALNEKPHEIPLSGIETTPLTVVNPVAVPDPPTLPPLTEEVIQTSSTVSSTGPSEITGQDSSSDSTDGPIALSTQNENSDL